MSLPDEKQMVVSIDIETSGLRASKHDVLEVAAIAFSLDQKEKDNIHRFHCFIRHDVVRWDMETLDFHMRNNYFTYRKDCLTRQVDHVPYLDPYNFQQEFQMWLSQAGCWKPIRGGGACAVGKNFATFDLQFLNRLNNNQFEKANYFKHRTIDLGNLLWRPERHGNTLPESKNVLEYLYGPDNEKVKLMHRAMDDAELMMNALKKWIGWYGSFPEELK